MWNYDLNKIKEIWNWMTKVVEYKAEEEKRNKWILEFEGGKMKKHKMVKS